MEGEIMEINEVPSLDTGHLVVFYVAATEGSLNAATDKLHLSQPTITYHIKCLEESLDLKLIGLKKQKLVCTPAGEIVLQYAEEIYKQLINVEKAVEFIKKSTLRVGIGPIYLPVITPVLQTIFENKFPEVKLIVKSGSAYDLVNSVVSYNLDLVIAQNWDYEHKELIHMRVSEPERLVCMASPAHPLCYQESVSLKDLTDYPLIMGPDSTTMNKMVFKKFKDEGLDVIPNFAVEANSTGLGKKLVENSIGISFTLAKEVENEVAEGILKLLPLKEEIWVSADAILRRDTYIHPIINEFISMVRQAFLYIPNEVDSPLT